MMENLRFKVQFEYEDKSYTFLFLSFIYNDGLIVFKRNSRSIQNIKKELL